jgi:glucose/arabinose dehydrogenase
VLTLSRAFRSIFAASLLLAGAVTHSSHTTQAAPGAAAELAGGFSDEAVATFGTGEIPTALSSTPDGRVLVGLKTGTLHIVENGTLRSQPALTLNSICTEGERGLESVTIDPAFVTNNHIYVFYSAPTAGSCNTVINRVVRYTLVNNQALTPTVILDQIPTGGAYHNGGDLHFGADGLLYVSVGDGGSVLGGGPNAAGNTNARNRAILNGKILRITSDGAIPTGNPYVSTPGSVICGGKAYNLNGGWCQETFAWGLRNPFKFAFKPGTNEFMINDVGQNTYEEINAGALGADYGWNLREGNCAPGSTTNCSALSGASAPLLAIDHNGFCSVTGAAFSDSSWPAPYAGEYFFGDYCGRSIYRLTRVNGVYGKETFHTPTDSGGIVALHYDAPSRALYYTLASTSSASVVRRIRATGAANRAPQAAAAMTALSGNASLSVQFSSAGSSDPDGDALTYEWQFNDGSAAVADANPIHTFNANGTYSVTLTVRDPQNLASAPSTVRVYVGNAAPQPLIEAPGNAQTFSVGELLTLRGSANDAEDGVLGDANLAWNVLLQHVPEGQPNNRHTHPFFKGSGRAVALPPMPQPEDLDATRYSYLEIQLTATDRSGQARTITQTLQPRRAALTLASQPSGLKITANDMAFVAPVALSSWEGMSLTLRADDPQRLNGSEWRFAGWSNITPASARSVGLIAPASATTYLATFANSNPTANNPTPAPTVQPAMLRTVLMPLVGR